MAGNGNGDWWDALTGGVSHLDFNPAQDYFPNLLGYGPKAVQEQTAKDAAYRAAQAALAQRSQVNIPTAPQQYSPAGKGMVQNPTYTDWQNKYGQQALENQRIVQAQEYIKAQAAQQAAAQQAQAAAKAQQAQTFQSTNNYVPTLGQSQYQQIGGKWYQAGGVQRTDSGQWVPTGKTLLSKAAPVQVPGTNNWVWTSDGTINGAVLGNYVPKGGNVSLPSLGSLGGSSGAPTWYEQQQVALDKQRITDAQNAQKFSESQSTLSKQEAASNAQESANQAFRTAQLQSTYGSITNADSGVPQVAPTGGYTGAGYAPAPIPTAPATPVASQPQMTTPIVNQPAPSPIPGMAAGGTVAPPTWYEQQQVALSQQQIADARKAQAWQQAQALQQQRLAEHTAIDTANQAFTDEKLKTLYGTINGMAYGAPKGARVDQQLPEPSMLAQGYKDLHVQSPWVTQPTYGGYTGSEYMNAQQPGSYSLTDPSMAIPKTGDGSIIPPAPSMARGGRVPVFQEPQANTDYGDAGITGYAPGGNVPGQPPGGDIPGSPGQPQLIMAHGGEHITPAPGTPLPALLGSPGGAPFSNPTDPNDPMNPGSPTTPSGNIQQSIMALIQAAQALVTDPDFSKLGIPIAPPSDSGPQDGSGGSPDASGGPPQGGPQVPGMAGGGMVGYPTARPIPGYLPLSQAVPGMAAGGTLSSDSRSGANSSGVPYSNAAYAVSPSGAVNSTNRSSANPYANLIGPPVTAPTTTNAYGQTAGSNVMSSPGYNDIQAGQGVLNHMPYSPVLTGLSGYGATMTPNGTPVVMSNWQRSHLSPNSISGPGGYDDYAQQVAGWSPADLQALGNSVTGGFGTDLAAPKNYAPITIPIAPAGG